MNQTDAKQKLIVEKKTHRLTLPTEGFLLSSGEYLPQVDVAYEAYGTLNAACDNAVLVCTPLTMDAHAAGWYSEDDKAPGWWDDMIGPGKALDTNRYCVIASNILGGCQGTTGPASIDPRTQNPYGSRFPLISIQDLVHTQYLLMKELGVQSLAAVIGGSMGGMQALQWSVAYPSFVRKCICIAAAHQLSPQALGFEVIGRKFVITDPNFQNGDYYNTPAMPSRGLAFARMIGLLTYLSADSMKSKFGREKQGDYDPKRFETGFEVENYLNHNAHKFTERFDANSYLHVTYAMDNFDLEALHGSVDKAFAGAQCEFLLIALSSDWLFLPQQSRELTQALLRLGKVVSLVELESPYGHDAFLLEVDGLSQVLYAYLDHEGGPHRGARRTYTSTNPVVNSIQKSEQSDEQKIAPISLNNAIQNAEKKEINQNKSAYTSSTSNTTIEDHDYFKLENLMEPGSHILDIGCGEGQLIDHFYKSHGMTGFGIEIEFDRIVGCLHKNVPVVQVDADKGLSLFGTRSFDYAVLSLTLHMLRNPQGVLQEMLRVANKGIIIFPNFGHWRKRLKFALRGKVPSYSHKGQKWWEDAPRRLFTYSDFKDLCKSENIHIEEEIALSDHGQIQRFLPFGGPNLWAKMIIARIVPMKAKSE